MEYKIFFVIVTVVLILCMLFANKKVRMLSICLKQLGVFKNANTNKVSFWDLSCFILKPIVLSVIIALVFDVAITIELASAFTTIFSIIFTILFGFATILVGRISSTNIIEKQIVSETFVSIISASLLALIADICSISFILIKSESFQKMLTLVIFASCFMLIMLLLLIVKRTFVVFCDGSGK